ncbi:MAG: hypothetical protein KKI08_00415 [Armatimonadetes bacterium]|nr:hypothetical protein [Armatimonadota bacterium]
MAKGVRGAPADAWSVRTGRHGMFRFKQIVGDRLRARTFERQKREAMIGVAIINRMTTLGMPESRAIRV